MIASTYNIPFILPLEMKLAAFLAALLAASTTDAGGYKRLEKCPRFLSLNNIEFMLIHEAFKQ